MAGKNQLLRIKIIDRQLRNGYKRTWQELADACEDAGIESISERSIKGDISLMRNGELGFPAAPIKSREGLYYYEDKEFTIFQSPIKDEAAFALMNALDILNQYPEFKQSQEVNEVIQKLKHALDIDEDETVQDVIRFEKLVYPAAEEWISLLYTHIKNKGHTVFTISAI